jgi:hypothetical protein
LVVWVISYVPGKCTTVIVVNWAEIGRSMTDRKFRVQSSLFRSLCIIPNQINLMTGFVILVSLLRHPSSYRDIRIKVNVMLSVTVYAAW